MDRRPSEHLDPSTAAVRPICRRWVRDARELDEAVYDCVAATPSPDLDDVMRRLASAADYAQLWLVVAAVLAGVAGRRGREVAAHGLLSVGAASVLVNVGGKRLVRRPRPDGPPSTAARAIPMPRSWAFPSGHSASAFAFSTAVGSQLPISAIPLHAAASMVAYSRLHTGVHYPSDVIFGSLTGVIVGQLTARLIRQRTSSR